MRLWSVPFSFVVPDLVCELESQISEKNSLSSDKELKGS